MTREVHKTWERTAQTLDADAIVLRAPFSIDFYRQFVRGTLEDPTQPLRRWTRAPQFFFHAMNGSGQPLAPSEVTLVRDAVVSAVKQLTGFDVTVFESSTEPRDQREDWINIEVVRNNDDYCGRAFVGANPGRITLNYGRCIPMTCGTGVPPPVVAHEVGHAMGFFHHDQPTGLMRAVFAGCQNINFTDTERYHASVAYRRPIGNVEPDRDPRTTATTLAPFLVVDRAISR